MIAPRTFIALIAGLLLSLPTPVHASEPGAGACFGNVIYQAFTDRSRVIQISVLFVVAGYFFLKGNARP